MKKELSSEQTMNNSKYKIKTWLTRLLGCCYLWLGLIEFDFHLLSTPVLIGFGIVCLMHVSKAGQREGIVEGAWILFICIGGWGLGIRILNLPSLKEHFGAWSVILPLALMYGISCIPSKYFPSFMRDFFK